MRRICHEKTACSKSIFDPVRDRGCRETPGRPDGPAGRAGTAGRDEIGNGARTARHPAALGAELIGRGAWGVGGARRPAGSADIGTCGLDRTANCRLPTRRRGPVRPWMGRCGGSVGDGHRGRHGPSRALPRAGDIIHGPLGLRDPWGTTGVCVMGSPGLRRGPVCKAPTWPTGAETGVGGGGARGTVLEVQTVCSRSHYAQTDRTGNGDDSVARLGLPPQLA